MTREEMGALVFAQVFTTAYGPWHLIDEAIRERCILAGEAVAKAEREAIAKALRAEADGCEAIVRNQRMSSGDAMSVLEPVCGLINAALLVEARNTEGVE